MDIALVSCRELPEPDPDAAPLAEALDAAGMTHRVVAWDDDDVDWSAATLTVLRSSWNYPLRHEQFLSWASRVEGVSALWNPLPVVRWNAHKSYLLALDRQGVPVTPTVLLPAGDPTHLRDILREREWTDIVIKPAVSAASFRTLRFGRGEMEKGEAHLRSLVREGDTLVQPYLASVDDYGERALVWVDGELTHAVRKTPRFDGDDEAVSGEPMPIASAEAALARRALAAVQHPLLYARIDCAPGPDGKPLVMELELVEPSLFFLQSATALERFVAALRRHLGR